MRESATTDAKKNDKKPKEEAAESRDAKTRSNLMGHLNAAIARFEAADKRVNDAKSNLGTAKRERVDARDNYTNLLEQLQKHLPKLDDNDEE